MISGTFKKADLCAESGIEYRDLRALDSRIPNLIPTILARRGAFLVNMLHIRALVKADEVLLFDVYGSTDSRLQSAFVYSLEHNLRLARVQAKSANAEAAAENQKKHASLPGTRSSLSDPLDTTVQALHGEDSRLPYEFRALETILSSVLDALHSELANLRALVSELLERLDADIDREKLGLLLQYRRKVSGLLFRSKAVKSAVAEILENDEDMALMYLTEAAAGRPRTSEMLQAEYDALELLLESFDKQVNSMVTQTPRLTYC